MRRRQDSLIGSTCGSAVGFDPFGGFSAPAGHREGAKPRCPREGSQAGSHPHAAAAARSAGAAGQEGSASTSEQRDRPGDHEGDGLVGRSLRRSLALLVRLAEARGTLPRGGARSRGPWRTGRCRSRTAAAYAAALGSRRLAARRALPRGAPRRPPAPGRRPRTERADWASRAAIRSVPTARSLRPRSFGRREPGPRVLLSAMHVYLSGAVVPGEDRRPEEPVPALLMFALAAGLLWFAIAQARRRDARRAGRGRRSDTWSRRPPRY
jgi:hypothetical protein